MLFEKFPKDIRAVVFDFDGVFTNNKVIVLEDGREAVLCDRGDGLAVGIFRQEFKNISLLILSKEKNPVVKARAKKLNLECLHGVDNKLDLLKEWAAERNILLSEIAYLGNDLNDIECIKNVGLGACVGDSYPEVKDISSLILSKNGGDGAIRELLWLIRDYLRPK